MHDGIDNTYIPGDTSKHAGIFKKVSYIWVGGGLMINESPK